MTMRVPFMSLAPGADAPAIRAAVDRVIASGWFILGPELEAFESEFAAASGAAHAVGVGTGTDAIALMLRALDIGPGDEVITSPLSAAFSALAIMMAGATPVFAELDPDRLTLDPSAVEAAITPRTTAILPVHLYGQPADMTRLSAIAARHSLIVVEDACQAHLATCDGRPVGAFGTGAAFSFYPTKNLGAYGDGGLVATNDRAIADMVRSRRMYGMISKDEFVEDGINTRLDELQAAVLRVKLKHLDVMNARRRAVADLYRELLPPAMQPQQIPHGIVPNYHVYAATCAGDRDGLVAALDAQSIQTNIYYPMPLTKQKGYRGATPPLETTLAVSRKIIALPMYPEIPEAIVRTVAKAIADHLEARA